LKIKRYYFLQLQGLEEFATAIPGITGDAQAAKTWPGFSIAGGIARTGHVKNQGGQCISGQVQLR